MPMKNVATKVEGNMLWIGVDLSAKQGRTKSGKATTIADSVGYCRVPSNPKFGMKLHVYEADEKKAAA
jgi:hypothetical protein